MLKDQGKTGLPLNNLESEASSSSSSTSSSGDFKGEDSRREFLEKASAALVILGAHPSKSSAQKTDASVQFQPEEQWADRIQAPDDGKRYGWFVDTRRCVGCHACEVSCKAENDVPLGNYIRQTFYKDVGEYPQVARPVSYTHLTLPTTPYV